MKPCKAKDSEGKPCPNQADKGQKYCPYHLGNQVNKAKKILSFVITGLGVFGVLLLKFAKFLVSKKL